MKLDRRLRRTSRSSLNAVAITAALTFLLPTLKARGADGPDVRTVGPVRTLFDPRTSRCDGSDVPDAPARAFRRADESIVVFGLHYTNHPLVGATLDGLKIRCRSAFQAHENPDPAAYDDRSWIASTWTRDGVSVMGLLHHEFQADQHPGRCRFSTYMQCWFNTVLAVRSSDGGATFVKSPSPVVASTPFQQDIEQGRHRGFFNPSNIVSDGSFFYFFASTTGWPGQTNGVCLFRTGDPDSTDSWRAYDGSRFATRFGDPYVASPARSSPTCAPIAPFPAPVGGLVRQRGTGVWFAVFQAQAGTDVFPVSGIYVAASHDLLHWSIPKLLIAGATNYDDPCGSGGTLLAYPTLIDPAASGRNFDNVGSTANLVYARMSVNGCVIGDRVLMSQTVALRLAR